MVFWKATTDQRPSCAVSAAVRHELLTPRIGPLGTSSVAPAIAMTHARDTGIDLEHGGALLTRPLLGRVQQPVAEATGAPLRIYRDVIEPRTLTEPH